MAVRRSRSPRGSGEILAEEILAAASELLLEQGDEAAVSIRAVAGRVGVTPPSIYLHFADKDALMDAVCARYFEHLDAAMQQAGHGVEDALERALCEGMAYVRFALANPVLYRVAFSKRSAAGQPSKVDEVLAAAAYRRFHATVSELADEGIFEHDEVADIVLELWTAAHGIASLMLAKPGLPWGDDLRHAENVMRSVFIGRAVLEFVGRRAEPCMARDWLYRQRAAVISSDDATGLCSDDNMVKRR